jgi:hypothetical protein
VALLQTKTKAAAATATPTTIAMVTTTTGSTIVVALAYSDPTANITTSITLSGGSFSRVLNVPMTSQSLDVWVAQNITGATTPTMSIAFINAPEDLAIMIREYSGLSASSLDKSVGTTGTSTTPSSGATATTTQASETIISIAASGVGTTQTYAAGTGYGNVAKIGASTTIDVGMADKTVSSTGTQTGTMTLGTSANWASVCVTLNNTVVATNVGTLLMMGVGV